MSIRLRKLHPLIGAEVTGVDLAGPLDRATVEAIKSAWSRYGVLLFPQQPITDEQQVAFSRHFGSLEIFPQAANRSRTVPEIFRVANVGDDDRIRPVDSPGARYSTLICVWHTDSSYRRVPSKGAVLHAIEVVGKGGDTLFANMCHAYQQMPGELKERIAGLKARHSFEYSRQLRQLPPMDPAEAAQVPAVDHPLVRRHRDGRLSLYVSATYMEAHPGAERSRQQGAHRRVDDLGHTGPVRLPASLASPRRPDVGQPLVPPRGDPLRPRRRTPGDASHHHRRHRTGGRGAAYSRSPVQFSKAGRGLRARRF